MSEGFTQAVKLLSNEEQWALFAAINMANKSPYPDCGFQLISPELISQSQEWPSWLWDCRMKIVDVHKDTPRLILYALKVDIGHTLLLVGLQRLEADVEINLELLMNIWEEGEALTKTMRQAIAAAFLFAPSFDKDLMTLPEVFSQEIKLCLQSLAEFPFPQQGWQAAPEPIAPHTFNPIKWSEGGFLVKNFVHPITPYQVLGYWGDGHMVLLRCYLRAPTSAWSGHDFLQAIHCQRLHWLQISLSIKTPPLEVPTFDLQLTHLSRKEMKELKGTGWKSAQALFSRFDHLISLSSHLVQPVDLSSYPGLEQYWSSVKFMLQRKRGIDMILLPNEIYPDQYACVLAQHRYGGKRRAYMTLPFQLGNMIDKELIIEVIRRIAGDANE